MRGWVGALKLVGLIAAVLFLAGVGIVVLPSLDSSLFLTGILLFAMACGIAYVVLAFSWPYAAILAAYFMIPFEYLTVLVPADAYGEGGAINQITLIKLMFGAIIGAGVTRMLVLKDERVFKNLWLTPIPVLLLLFYSLMWMSLVNTDRIAAFALNMISIGSGVIAFFILINILNTTERVYLFLKVVFVSYIIIALMGMFEAVTKQHVMKIMGQPMIERPWTQNPSAFRICGPSGDPDYYAISMIFGLMITFAVLPLAKSLRGKVIVLAVAFFDFLVIIATASRGAALSTALALSLFYLLARFRHKLLVGVGAATLLIGGFIAFSLTVSQSAAARLTSDDTTSWTERWGWIQMSYEMMLDAPVTGVGSGQFVTRYPHYMGTWRVPREPESAQNTYAQLAAQNGIPTTLIYLFANIAAWIFLYRVMRDTRDPIRRHLAVSFLVLAISFWVFSLTLDLVETEISWIIFAMGVVLWRQLLEEKKTWAASPVPIPAGHATPSVRGLTPAIR